MAPLEPASSSTDVHEGSSRRGATVADIRLAAIYRFGLSRRLSRSEVAAILTNRASLVPSKARQLTELWFTSEPYRTVGTGAQS